MTDWRSLRRAYPRFPFPEPHGSYSSYFDEVRSQTPNRWLELVRGSGWTDIELHPLAVFPYPLLEAVLGRLGLRLYRRWLLPFDRWLSRTRILRSLAQFQCIVATRPGLSDG